MSIPLNMNEIITFTPHADTQGLVFNWDAAKELQVIATDSMLEVRPLMPGNFTVRVTASYEGVVVGSKTLNITVVPAEVEISVAISRKPYVRNPSSQTMQAPSLPSGFVAGNTNGS